MGVLKSVALLNICFLLCTTEDKPLQVRGLKHTFCHLYCYSSYTKYPQIYVFAPPPPGLCQVIIYLYLWLVVVTSKYDFAAQRKHSLVLPPLTLSLGYSQVDVFCEFNSFSGAAFMFCTRLEQQILFTSRLLSLQNRPRLLE